MTLDEKQEFIAVDMCKFICALLVVAIHLPPFADLNAAVSYGLQQIICRLAVPFFFLCSGFFLDGKMESKEQVMEYVKHIGKLYIFWSLLYFPQMIERYYSGKTFAQGTVTLLQRCLFVGSYIQLWYLYGTMIAVLMFYYLLRWCKGNLRMILSIAGLLYLFGMCGNAYRPILSQIPTLKIFFQRYLAIFVTTRNGIFFGLFFIVIGYYIGKNRQRIKKQTYGLGVLAGILLLFLEDGAISKYFPKHSHDMLISLTAASLFLFLFVLFLPVSKQYEKVGKWMRSMSTLLFVLHMLVNFYAGRILKGFLDLEYNSAVKYLLAVAGSLVIGQVILHRKKKRQRRIK